MAEKECIENPVESQEASSDEIKDYEQCDPCLISDKSSTAQKYCNECEEKLCGDCARNHSKRKATSLHKLILIQEIQPSREIFCSPCADGDKSSKAVTFCEMCEEYLCSTCTHSHKIRKATSLHQPINIEDLSRFSKTAETKLLCLQCEDNGIRSSASNYCEECEEYLCEMCRESHSIRKATKSHRPVPISSLKVSDTDGKTDNEENSKMCDPCTFLNKCVIALSFCTQCEELLCADCANLHRARKLTKSHALKSTQSAEIVKTECGICESKIDQGTIMYCNTCEETLCERCANKHKQKKMFKSHSMKAANVTIQNPTIKCDPCKGNNEIKSAETFCKQCEEHLCEVCTRYHKAQKMTKKHDLIDPMSQSSDTTLSPQCDPCLEDETQVKATSYCLDCEENFCDVCRHRHLSMKISKNHKIVDISSIISRNSTMCSQCQEDGRSVNAIRYCEDCEEYFCEECCKVHKRYKVTKSHNLLEVSEIEKSRRKYGDIRTTPGTKPVEERLDGGDLTDRDVKPDPQHKKEMPGMPKYLSALSDTITLSWDSQSQLDEKDRYELSFKVQDQDVQWKIVPDKFATTSAEVKNLKSNTAHIFRVRVVCEDSEGPWSEESDTILTLESVASQIVKFSVKVRDGDPAPAVYALPMTEVQAARDENARLKKFEFGAKSVQGGKASTILLAGVVGTGKSTMVDGFVNYVLGVNWDDPFRFTVSNGTQHASDRALKNDAFTDWITTYTINPQKGSLLQHQLNIIDIPGLGDSRGLESDLQILKQIRQFLSETESKGITSIDAVCLLLKASDARFTVTQSYIYQSIISLFGKDIEKNVCALITFSDGQDPPVLSPLRQAGIPFRTYFTFNFSSLFANHKHMNLGVAKCLWDMGINNFRAFFEHIERTGTASLQLTKSVLGERSKIEAALKSLQPKFEAGRLKLDSLKLEMRIIEECKINMKVNKDFMYEISETQQRKIDLPFGQYVNNCRRCNITCHRNCTDNEKNRCSVMNASGYCTVCPDQCYWDIHSKTQYFFEYTTVKVMKTYEDMRRKFENAEMRLKEHKQIGESLSTELEYFMANTRDVLLQIKRCNVRLQDTAITSDPLASDEFIDLLVENEKLVKNPDFLKRISLLNEFRNRTRMSTEFDNFTEEVNGTLGKSSKVDKMSSHGMQSFMFNFFKK